MVKLMSSLLTVLLFFFIHLSTANAAFYNVVDLGAKPDGKTDSAGAFLAAWAAACGSASPAVIYVPKGWYLLGHVAFKGQCKNTDIKIQIDGTLIAPDYYSSLSNTEYWLLFEGVTGVSISGGFLDGKGKPLWDCKAAGRNCPAGATSLSFTNSNNIKIIGLHSFNSKMFHIVINGCHDVNMDHVRINAPGDSPNTDGIHVQMSTNVGIYNSGIKTGDDCISIGPGTTNLKIRRVHCGPGHGISIGSLGKEQQELGVTNVTAKGVVFTGTQNGVRIKTWAKPCNGFVYGVHFENVIMVNVQNPIVIDQNYCPRNEGCPNQASGVKISGVTYRDIRGTSATEVAVKFDCSPTNPCQGIILDNLNLAYNNNQQAKSYCKNAHGKVYRFVNPASCL